MMYIAESNKPYARPIEVDMSGKFFCIKKGGIRRGDFGSKSMSGNENAELIIMEGTREKGPWYEPGQFPEETVRKWRYRGWIEDVVLEEGGY